MSSSVEISIPQELSQQVHSGNVVLFVGAGLSIGAGLPSWDALIRPLAEHIGYTGGDWLKAAQYYENQSGRNALISYLRDRLNTTGITPTENHTLLTRLPVNIVFTTNLDDLLEWAYRSAGRRVNLVVGATGLTMWDESQVNLVKLHGTYDRPETFIITEKDYNTFYRHNALLVQQLGALLATKTFLFAGYSVSDPDFNQLYDQLGVDLGRYQRRPYLVTFDVDPFKAKDLEQRGYCVINLPGEGDRNARLGEWLGALLKAVAAPGPEATSRLPQAAVPPPLPFQPPAMPPSSPQPIATPPSSSTPSVQIVTPEGLKLTKQQRDILQHVYQDFRQVIVEAELVGGLGGACVLLVVPVAKDDRPAARRVVKLGYALELRRERNRYKQYVEPVLPMRVTQVESERYYEQGDQAGLSYIFVGGSVFGDAVDLDQYYRRSFPQAVKKLHRTLNVLLDKNLGQGWYRQSAPLTCQFAAEYSRCMVEHLQLRLHPKSSDRLWSVDQPPSFSSGYQQIETDAILHEEDETIQPGTLLSIEGLCITQIRHDAVILQDSSGQGIVVLVKFTPGSNAAQGLNWGDRVGVCGTVVHNRRDRMREIARTLFPGLPSEIEGESIQLPDWSGGTSLVCPNPLQIYPKALGKVLEGRRSYTHGDLHLRNVLVDKDGRAWPIDFAKADERHNLFDFITLETRVRMAELAREDCTFSLRDYVQFEHALNDATLGGRESPPADPHLRFAYQVILDIRRIARKYMGPDPSFENEYFPALFLYCLGTTRYSKEGVRACRLAFATACIAGKYIQDDTIQPTTTANKARQNLWTAALLGVLGLINRFPLDKKLLAVILAVLAGVVAFTVSNCCISTRLYQVQVEARDTGQYLPNAKVTIEIGGKAPLDAITDVNGFASIQISCAYANQPAILIVEATGYKKHKQNIDLSMGALPKVIQLEPE